MSTPQGDRDLTASIEAAASGPRIGAIFDFDGTLIEGYSLSSFLGERIRRREFSVGEALRTARSLIDAYGGAIDPEELLRRGLREWAGMRERDLQAMAGKLYTEDLQRRVYPEARRLIEAHARKRHTLLVASSATRYQVERVAHSLGIRRVLCTEVELHRGRLTGEVRGEMLFGAGKAAAVRRYAAQHGVDLARSWFYADGDEDEALMHLVGEPRPTNPRPQLARVARRRGWPVQRFAGLAPGGAEAQLRKLLSGGSIVPVLLGAAAIRALTGDKREAANLLTSAWPDLLLAFGKVQLRIVGEQHLWSRRPAVFIWNHRNNFDAQIVGKLVRRDFGAVAKKELESVPVFAAASRFMHIAFVERGDPAGAVKALEPATQLLRQGISMVVAPEGTRISNVPLGPFKKGAFRMAMSAGVPIVPIVVRNALDIGDRDATFMRPGTVDVAVLPPIDVGGWTVGDLDARIEEVRQRYLATLDNWPRS